MMAPCAMQRSDLMGQGAHIARAVTAAIMTMAPGSLAHAADVSADVDMTPYLGSWGNGSGYNCESRGGDETAPLVIERNYLGGYLVGAYEFSCSLTKIEQRRTSVVAETHCGHEGTD